jgi:hypothetical protein
MVVSSYSIRVKGFVGSVILPVYYVVRFEPAASGGRTCSWWRSTARAEEPSPARSATPDARHSADISI